MTAEEEQREWTRKGMDCRVRVDRDWREGGRIGGGKEGVFEGGVALTEGVRARRRDNRDWGVE